MGPGDLERILGGLDLGSDPHLLVSTATRDDAAVWQLSAHQALVQSVDFFAPIADDPYVFGQIAAANALSDLYAMGARPLFALALAAWPTALPLEMLGEVMRGGSDKVREAGALIVGGHTVKDDEPKYGLAVTGTVDPRRVVTNAGARVGDRLFLTKPLGSGVLSTAGKNGALSARVRAKLERTMSELNRGASEAMLAVRAHAATDITGFGLLGHALEMAGASGVRLEFNFEALPWIQSAREMAQQGHTPGGTESNRAALTPRADVDELDDLDRSLICDPQTSGGLLIAVPPRRGGRLADELTRRGVLAAEVGRAEAGEGVAVRKGANHRRR